MLGSLEQAAQAGLAEEGHDLQEVDLRLVFLHFLPRERLRKLMWKVKMLDFWSESPL